jgi:AhpD family alkylhydroperoxidase
MTRGPGRPHLCNLGLMDETSAPEHSTRSVFLDKAHPAAWRALNGLGLKAKEAAEEAGLDQALIELLNVRISQINGCAFCLDLHVGDAVKNGESAQRLAVLPAWRDTTLFSEKERAALTLAEAITNISDAEAREHEGGRARRNLTDAEFSAVSWLAITMNAFNRVSIVSQHPVRNKAQRGKDQESKPE